MSDDLSTGSSTQGMTSSSANGASAGDVKKGFTKPALERTDAYDPETDGGTNVVAKDAPMGGVCGRPQGWAR